MTLAIARRMSGKLGLDENATNAFALGLKLFGEAILKNRENPLFGQIKPSMVGIYEGAEGWCSLLWVRASRIRWSIAISR